MLQSLPIWDSGRRLAGERLQYISSGAARFQEEVRHAWCPELHGWFPSSCLMLSKQSTTPFVVRQEQACPATQSGLEVETYVCQS